MCFLLCVRVHAGGYQSFVLCIWVCTGFSRERARECMGVHVPQWLQRGQHIKCWLFLPCLVRTQPQVLISPLLPCLRPGYLCSLLVCMPGILVSNLQGFLSLYEVLVLWCYCVDFTWVLSMESLGLILGWLALYPLSHLSTLWLVVRIIFILFLVTSLTLVFKNLFENPFC